MVSKFRNTHLEFVAKYRSARVIVDRVSTTTKSKAPSTPAPAAAK
ncbi:MAG: hypothetical protein QM715_07385 [Nibricoccus sp.]